jgi:surface antigen
MAATTVLALILLTTLTVVLPVDSASRGSFGIFQPIVGFVKSNNSNIGLVAQQAATATAVTQDGYDPGGGRTYAGIPVAPDSPGSTLSRFFYGQCTYWANYRYHQLTGHWVAWLGNADEWVYGAQSYGWTVSASPKVFSIIVLMPGTQGAGPYGHVAIVESINANGTVNTSNFNWQGNWAVETIVQFTPGPGVYFVSYPR